jgi:hypothetical protein
VRRTPFSFGVEAKAKRKRCKTGKPEDSKITGFNAGAFLRLLAYCVALCIIAGVRQPRQAVEWKTTDWRICYRSFDDSILP